VDHHQQTLPVVLMDIQNNVVHQQVLMLEFEDQQ
jgi:hypothetical protein